MSRRQFCGRLTSVCTASAPPGGFSASTTPDPPPDPYQHARHDDGPIPLTVNDIRRLFTVLATATIHTITHRLRWSNWRRLHKARARRSHYKRPQTPHKTASGHDIPEFLTPGLMQVSARRSTKVCVTGDDGRVTRRVPPVSG